MTAPTDELQFDKGPQGLTPRPLLAARAGARVLGLVALFRGRGVRPYGPSSNYNPSMGAVIGDQQLWLGVGLASNLDLDPQGSAN